MFYNVNNILGLQIMSRKNITLVYKDGLDHECKNTKTIIRQAQ